MISDLFRYLSGRIFGYLLSDFSSSKFEPLPPLMCSSTFLNIQVIGQLSYAHQNICTNIYTLGISIIMLFKIRRLRGLYGAEGVDDRYRVQEFWYLSIRNSLITISSEIHY